MIRPTIRKMKVKKMVKRSHESTEDEMEVPIPLNASKEMYAIPRDNAKSVIFAEGSSPPLSFVYLPTRGSSNATTDKRTIKGIGT